MTRSRGKVFINNVKNSGKNSCLFVIIEEVGNFAFDSYSIFVCEDKNDINCGKIFSAKLPFSIEIQENELKNIVSARAGKEVFFCYTKNDERLEKQT